jgi:hypothetical protein
MFMSITLIGVWVVISLAYFGVTIYWGRQHHKQAASIRELKRTVDKLQRKNGKLWYDLMRKQGGNTSATHNDITSTNL